MHFAAADGAHAASSSRRPTLALHLESILSDNGHPCPPAIPTIPTIPTIALVAASTLPPPCPRCADDGRRLSARARLRVGERRAHGVAAAPTAPRRANRRLHKRSAAQLLTRLVRHMRLGSASSTPLAAALAQLGRPGTQLSRSDMRSPPPPPGAAAAICSGGGRKRRDSRRSRWSTAAQLGTSSASPPPPRTCCACGGARCCLDALRLYLPNCWEHRCYVMHLHLSRYI